MSAGVLLRAGTDEQKREWLPRIVAGDAILTTAWLEPRQRLRPARACRRRATADGDGFVLDGVKWHVPFASSATALVVLARTGDGDDDVDLFLVDPAAAGVTLHTAADDRVRHAVRGRRSSGVRVPASARIGAAGSGWATWHDTMLDGIVLLAAQAIGGARYALDITVQYAKDREQFDKPLGAFQAIAHYLADAVDDGRRRRDARVRSGLGARRRPRRSTSSRRWRSCSRARRSATSPRWPSRCSAASASRSSTTSSSTSAGRSSSRSRGGTTASSKSSSPTTLLD